ncbi:MAG: Gfo/Idh/MocA family protein [Jatrophihabitans sp.]
MSEPAPLPRRIEVGIFGTGDWAQHAHLPALRGFGAVDVVGCADLELSRAASVAERFGAGSVHASLDGLLDAHPDLDLLIIAAPDDAHPSAVRAALARRVAVFCEKPLANSGDEAVELAALADAVGIVTTVGYSFRYSPAVQALRTDLLSGELGEVWLVELTECNAQFHPTSGRTMNWKGDPAHARGGALFEYGSHVVDLCQWLFGPVLAVSSHLIRVLPGSRLDDIATLQLRLAYGGAATLTCGWVLTGGYPGIRIRVHTSTGLAEVELSSLVPGKERYSRFSPDGVEVAAAEPTNSGDVSTTVTARHLADLFAQLDENAAGSTVLPTIDDAARTQLVLDAALGAEDHWISVPLPCPKSSRTDPT